MPRGNFALVTFNRGIIDPEALARVDIDRTALSSETMTNWFPKTQGPMRIRPGTKYIGSTLNDTGAAFVEFVAATDSSALLELTDVKMRVWNNDTLISRPYVSTTLDLTDTGWYEIHSGGGGRFNQPPSTPSTPPTSASDLIPVMTGDTTSGVTITASGYDSYNHNYDSQNYNPWRVANNNSADRWEYSAACPQWIRVDFGSGNTRRVKKLTLRAANVAEFADNTPTAFQLQGSANGSSWTTEHSFTTTNWSTGVKRTFTDTGFTDTGANAYRYWRIYATATQDPSNVAIAELELFDADTPGAPGYVSDTGQAIFTTAGNLILNSGAVGSVAIVEKAVVISDTGMYNVEHSLDIAVARGPIILRVGTTSGSDDLIRETSLNTGNHNLAFTPPSSPFYVTVATDEDVDRVISRLTIGDTGTLEVTTPWAFNNLSSIRYDQSADVVFANADGVHPYRIERRGDGRSWSVVENTPENGPFGALNLKESIKLNVTGKIGNVVLQSNVPYFNENNVGDLYRITHDGQSRPWYLGTKNAATDGVQVNGIGDTGTPGSNNERRIVFAQSGTYSGTVTIERSFDGPDFGFHPATPDFMSGNAATDTGTFTRTIDDEDHNVTVWYRARLTSYTSGAAKITVTQKGSFTQGIVRVTAYTDDQNVNAEVIKGFSDTGPASLWEAGIWSKSKGFPTAVALHEGRLCHAGKSVFYASASDDYTNFDDNIEGESAPLIKNLGSGPVDDVNFLASAGTLIAGTVGSEISIRASIQDEPITPANSSAKTFSTLGSTDLRALKHDLEVFFVQRSGQRVYQLGVGIETGDIEPTEMTVLVPTLLSGGVVDFAIQRFPDSRFHFVLSDGRVAILTYERKEDVLCWSVFETDGVVEKVAVLPGVEEDKVYYIVRRTINSVTKRFIERIAKESESVGDTGLSWLSDCAVSYTDTGRTTEISGLGHLVGESVIAWSNDTGQSNNWGMDHSWDTGDPANPGSRISKTYTVDTGGSIVLTRPVHHAVVGLPYVAKWKSTKLAYAAAAGTALAQMKRTDKIGFILYKTHNNAIRFGNDTGNLDALPRVIDEGGVVDPDKIFVEFDQMAMPFPGLWSSDSRIYIEARAPRPVNILGVVPNVQTSDKV